MIYSVEYIKSASVENEHSSIVYTNHLEKNYDVKQGVKLCLITFHGTTAVALAFFIVLIGERSD